MSLKNTKNKPSKICGKTQAQIRKAYFEKSLDDLIDDIQAKQPMTVDDTKEITAFLELLAAEKNDVRATLKTKGFDTGTNDLKPPTVDELSDNIDPVKLKEWVERVEKDRQYAMALMTAVGNAANRKSLNTEHLKDVILEITTRMTSIDQDRVYKDQLYRARLTGIIDKYGISRAEAEERAKLTKEYQNYKLAVLFKENLIEFIMACKKKVGSNW